MTIYLFKALADILMLLPLTVFQQLDTEGVASAFVSTALLFAISNGIEFFDLIYKSDMKKRYFMKWCIGITVIAMVIMVIVCFATLMNYLVLRPQYTMVDGIQTGVKLFFCTPNNSLLGDFSISYTLFLVFMIFPIITHLLAFFCTYTDKNRKNFYNRLIY